jgi:hypothetical protein
MLMADWNHCPASGSANSRSAADAGWKNRNVHMTALLKYFVDNHSKPLDVLLQLAQLLTESPLPETEYAGEGLQRGTQ